VAGRDEARASAAQCLRHDEVAAPDQAENGVDAVDREALADRVGDGVLGGRAQARKYARVPAAPPLRLPDPCLVVLVGATAAGEVALGRAVVRARSGRVE